MGTIYTDRLNGGIGYQKCKDMMLRHFGTTSNFWNEFKHTDIEAFLDEYNPNYEHEIVDVLADDNRAHGETIYILLYNKTPLNWEAFEERVELLERLKERQTRWILSIQEQIKDEATVSKIHRYFEEFRELRNLDFNWDDDGAEEMNKKLFDEVIGIVRKAVIANAYRLNDQFPDIDANYDSGLDFLIPINWCIFE